MSTPPSLRSTRLWGAGLAIAAISAVTPGSANADDASEIREIHAEIQALEQRLAALEAREAAQSVATKAPAQPAAAPKAAPAAGANVTFGQDGFRVVTPDKANALHVGSEIQVDSRLFFGDGGGVANNTFVLRRARLIVDGAFDTLYSFQLVPEFGGTAAPSIVDANVGASFGTALRVKIGKFKAPVGLEQLQSDASTFFVERSLATNVTPGRDIGAEAYGAAADGILQYQAAVLNGVPDNSNSTNQDFDNDKEADARIVVEPFHREAASPLRGLGVGVAGSYGRQKGAAGLTSGYKTDGQQTLFKYNASAVGAGITERVSPQGYYFAGPLGVLAEYVASTVHARSSAAAPVLALHNRAWAVQGVWTLTGEKSTYEGVDPRQPFDPAKGAWGAWQLAARYADLRLDSALFPSFASPTSNAKEDSAWGAGVNWYLDRAVRVSLDGFYDHFTDPAASTTQILQHDERSLITRVQLAF